MKKMIQVNRILRLIILYGIFFLIHLEAILSLKMNYVIFYVYDLIFLLFNSYQNTFTNFDRILIFLSIKFDQICSVHELQYQNHIFFVFSGFYIIIYLIYLDISLGYIYTFVSDIIFISIFYDIFVQNIVLQKKKKVPFKNIDNEYKYILIMMKNFSKFVNYFFIGTKYRKINTSKFTLKFLHYKDQQKLQIYKLESKIKSTYNKYIKILNPDSKLLQTSFWMRIFIGASIYILAKSLFNLYDADWEMNLWENTNLSEIKKVNIYSNKNQVQIVFKNEKKQVLFKLFNVNSFIQKFQEKQKLLGFTEFIPLYFKDTALDINDMLKSIQLIGSTLLSVYILASLIMMRKKFNINSMFGNNKFNKKVNCQKDIKVKFKDVAGMQQAKQEIAEFVEFLKSDTKFKQMGAKIPRGALLTGPPGTGKTMLAKACAGQAGVSFFYMSGSEFIEMYGGLGSARVRQLFNQAKKESPSIIFIDQIDAVGKKRQGSSNQESDSTLNQLLVEMDGFNTNQNVIVLAASNRKQVLDKALIRPGRFDRLIQIQLPDIGDRIQIFKVHLLHLKLNPNKSLPQLAKRLATLTPGFSGADIANLCNQAAILAARLNKTYIQDIDFQMAAQRVMAGLQKKNMMTPQEKKIVSYHEAGHAVVSWFLQGGDPLIKVTIIPRSKGSLGYAQYLPNESSLKTKQQLYDRIAIILGGRLSEQHFFGKITTGAADDLQKVYTLCRNIVTRFGMNQTIGNVGLEEQGYINNYSKKTGMQIDIEMLKIIKICQQNCRNLIKQKAVFIEKLAQRLMQKESLDSNQITLILGERPFEPTENYKNYISNVKPNQKSD